MKAKDIWEGFGMRLRVIIMAIALLSTLSGFGFTVYSTFAKESDFNEFVAVYNFDKDIQRANWLDEKVWKCRERYGDKFEKASDDIKEMCRNYQREQERIEEKIKKGIKGLSG